MNPLVRLIGRLPDARPLEEVCMGIRERLLKKARKVADRFSGEFSDPAPDEREPYARPGVPDENAEVVMAQLKRPKGKRTKS